MTRFIFILYLFVGLLVVTAQQMTSNGNMRTNPRTLVTIQNDQVLRGADLYFEHCAVCHGDTALGLAEAKTSFLEEDRRCTRCHKPNNPKIVDWSSIQDNNMFDIGQPTALRGDGTLDTFPNASVLYSYTKATMPRYEPGRLENAEYLDVTAFLAHINGVLPEDLILTEQNALDVTFE